MIKRLCKYIVNKGLEDDMRLHIITLAVGEAKNNIRAELTDLQRATLHNIKAYSSSVWEVREEALGEEFLDKIVARINRKQVGK